MDFTSLAWRWRGSFVGFSNLFSVIYAIIRGRESTALVGFSLIILGRYTSKDAYDNSIVPIIIQCESVDGVPLISPPEYWVCEELES